MSATTTQQEIIRQVRAAAPFAKISLFLTHEDGNTVTVVQRRKNLNTEITYVPGRDTYTVKAHKLTSQRKLSKAYLEGREDEVPTHTTKVVEDVYAEMLENFIK